MRNLLFVCITILGLKAFGYEAGKFFIRNFTSKDYHGHTQNWVVEQDSNGVMYFGNQAGVLSFDGYFWRTIPISNHSTVRSLTIDTNGRIYAGAVGDFGYLEPNASGKMVYHSLVPLLDSAFRDFGNVWNCAALGHKVFFLTDNWLYIYNQTGFSVLPTRGDYFYALYVLENDLYVHDYGVGLLKYANDSLSLVPGGKHLDVHSVHAVLPYDTEHLLIGVRNVGFILLNKLTGNLSLLNKELSEFMADAELYHAIVLDQFRYAIATIRKGIVIIDRRGNILNQINKSSGLQDETVYFLKRSGGVLWAALEKGISIIEWQTPIRYWDELSGLQGSITDMIRFNNQMIVSTGSGVFQMIENSKGETSYFKSMDEVADQAWDLQTFKIPGSTDSILLVGIGKGLWKITSNKTERIFRGEGVYKILPSTVYPDRVYLGMVSGLGYLSYDTHLKTFSDLQMVAEFNNEVRDIFETPDGSLWISLAYKGAAFIDINKSSTNSDAVIFYGPDQGLQVKRELLLFKCQHKLCFSCEYGVFNFDSVNQRFIADSMFAASFKIDPERTTYYSTDNKGTHWINGRYRFVTKDSVLIEDSDLLKRLPDFNTEFQYIDSDRSLWIGTSEGIYRVKPREETAVETTFKVLLRSVYSKNDSLLYWGNSTLNTTPKLEHKNNFIGFVYTAGFYEKPEAVQYSFLLEGYDNQWSEWSNINQKEFTNLFERTYIFRVKAKNYLGVESREAVFTFTIKPPWYRTWFAYVLYTAGVILIVTAIVLYRTRKLRYDKIRLESIIRERTMEIIRQKDEIEASAISLAEANRELQKLSLIAQKTDNAVSVFDATGNMEWVNEGFTHLFGYTLEQFVDEKGRNLVQSSSNLQIADALKNCIERKESIIYQYFTLTRNQQGVWAQTTLTPILDEAGNITRIIAIDSDITKVKDAEQEIEHQRDELKKANDTKDKFFSIIAHDLRGPLSTVFTLLNILHTDLDLFDKEQLKTLIGQMKEATGKTFNLTENLLDWANLRRDSIPYRPKNISISEIVDENLELFQSQASKKQIQLENELPDAVDVFADEEMIKTIIRNLLGNAIKFTGAGGQVRFKASETTDKWCIHVIDTGTGMDKDEIDKLFRIDIQHSTPGTLQEKGSGLGLILIKEFLDKNKGEIRVESVHGKGSTFSICLPKTKAN
ncbi:MAG: ATP-binding protein [Salinivirgaceae bacterium]